MQKPYVTWLKDTCRSPFSDNLRQRVAMALQRSLATCPLLAARVLTGALAQCSVATGTSAAPAVLHSHTISGQRNRDFYVHQRDDGVVRCQGQLARSVFALLRPLGEWKHHSWQQQQRGYAASPEEVSSSGRQSEADALVIDASAAERLHQLNKRSGGTPQFLRIEVEGGGCSGFQYKFRLDSTVNEDDRVFEKDGARVVCDSVSLPFLRGAKVEFVDTLMRAAFQIGSNPNSEASCGCGTSFTAKMA